MNHPTMFQSTSSVGSENPAQRNTRLSVPPWTAFTWHAPVHCGGAGRCVECAPFVPYNRLHPTVLDLGSGSVETGAFVAHPPARRKRPQGLKLQKHPIAS